jgi:hypothetical protein
MVVVFQKMEGLMFLQRVLHFDEPSLRGVFLSTTITHLRIMGRGIKWAITILV